MSASLDTTTAAPKQILMVISNPATSTTVGGPVGFWASELTHPYLAFREAGYEVTIASPDGEEAPLEDVELDGATLSFSFDGGEYGRLTVVATIEGDELDGSITVPGQGGIRLTGTRTPGNG